MTPADKPELVACPECGHLAGEESDLLTIAYMSGVYDERKSRENGLRTLPTPDINYARLVPISQRETEYILPASLKFAILAQREKNSA